MRLKKKHLAGCKLYLIVDTQVSEPKKIFDIAVRAVDAGVDIIQLRNKGAHARDTVELARQLRKIINGRVPFLVNDRADVALAAGADGVHLGQDDLPVETARRILGRQAIIGVSCQRMYHAVRAEEQTADYIGFGSVFKTLTKPERSPMDLRLLSRVMKNLGIPVFAIGGINLQNVDLLVSRGIERIAVTRAVSEAEDIEQVVKQFQEKLCAGVPAY